MIEKSANAWLRIVRDAALVAVGGFMLVYATVYEHSPNPYVIAGGLTALGLPSAIRFDIGVRRNNGAVNKDGSEHD